MHDEDDLYSPDHIDDPVTRDAVNAALAVVRPGTRHRSTGPLFLFFVVLLVIVGTGSAVVSAINSITVHHQTDTIKSQTQQLQAEQACIVKLQKQVAVEQAVRNDISNDDREAIDTYIKKTSVATTHQQVVAAQKKYFAQRAENNKRRTKYAALIPDIQKCATEKVNQSSTNVKPNSSSTSPSKNSDSPSATPSTSAAEPNAGGGSSSPKVRTRNSAPSSKPTKLRLVVVLHAILHLAPIQPHQQTRHPL